MLLEDRKAQLFPTLTPRQRGFAIRFASGAARRFEADEKVFDVGDRNAGVWLVAEGGIIATRRDGLGREQLFATYRPSQFSGEISELGGRASLTAARAAPEGCVAYPVDAPHLRALVIGSAEIGELMMRAFILRRAALLEGGSVGSVVLGEAGSPDTVASRAPVTEQLSALADRCGRSGGQSSRRAARRACGRFAHPDLSKRNVVRHPSDADAGVGLGIIPVCSQAPSTM